MLGGKGDAAADHGGERVQQQHQQQQPRTAPHATASRSYVPEAKRDTRERFESMEDEIPF